MSKSKKQFYVVINGRKPGIYSNWFGAGEAAEQVKGYPDAVYKGFFTREAAIDWLNEIPKKNLLNLAPDLVEFLDPARKYTSNSSSASAVLLDADKVVMFTDGSTNPQTGAGGYGVILKQKGRVKELSGGFRQTTNNRMEIYACIAGLRQLKNKSDVVIFSDSQYVVNSMSKGWAIKWQKRGWMRNKKDRAENADLWEQLLSLCDQHSVEFRWVKGHNSTKENERCDRLAVQASRKKNLPSDTGYENGKASLPGPLFSNLTNKSG